MKIELLNVIDTPVRPGKIAVFLADIHIDGKERGFASDTGFGSGTKVLPPELAVEMDAYAATLPSTKLGLGDGRSIEHTQTAVDIIGDLLAQFHLENDLRKLMSKRIVFTKNGAKGIFQTKTMTVKQKTRFLAHLDTYAAKNMDVILNGLHFEEAFEVYKTNVR